MREEFKAFGGKAWGITDNGLIYKNELIDYSKLSKFRLISTPTTALTNGVVQVDYNGKILTLAFKYADKDRVNHSLYFANQQIDAANGVFKDCKYHILAHTGTSLEVYDTYLIINFMQTGSILTNIGRGGALGGKRISFVDLTSIQFKEPAGMTVGFLQFAYPGSVESKGGIIDMINDENSVPIKPKDVELAREIVSYIEQRKNDLKQINNSAINDQQISSADEIVKFKNLLDAGIISHDEFELKKKQLLRE